MADHAQLQLALGHQFADADLLKLALSHRSTGSPNNERLEFLGDSILNHIVAEAIYQQFPQAREGEMSRMRASLVCGAMLSEVAGELHLSEHLQLGVGEKKSGGKQRGSILANTLEAIAGAILLDAGFETCRRCILSWFDGRLSTLSPESTSKDPKTELQEYLQARRQPLPAYELQTVSGADHEQKFEVVCSLHAAGVRATGSGRSRRKAEQAAARCALEQLAADNP